jgi:hypothetical protein
LVQQGDEYDRQRVEMPIMTEKGRSARIPGLCFSKVKQELLGGNPNDWRSYVEVRAPSIRELMQVVSLGDRYLLSLGAHGMHTALLIDRCAPDPLTVENCLNCCSLLTFASDSPVVPIPRSGKLNAPNAAEVTRKFRGTVYRSVTEYSDRVGDIVELAEVYVQSGLTPPQHVTRLLVPRDPPNGFWIYYPWPPSEPVFRGLAAYWLATLSVFSPLRILNCWRSIEAVTTKEQRESVFSELHKEKVAPVWTETVGIPIPKHSRRRIDAASALRRLAVKRRDELIAGLGSSKDAIDYLYWKFVWGTSKCRAR